MAVYELLHRPRDPRRGPRRPSTPARPSESGDAQDPRYQERELQYEEKDDDEPEWQGFTEEDCWRMPSRGIAGRPLAALDRRYHRRGQCAHANTVRRRGTVPTRIGTPRPPATSTPA